MLERLWSAWRATYVSSSPGPATPDEARSVFIQLLESGRPDDETHVIHRGPTCFVVANAFPYTSGHVLVVPYRQVPDLVDLDGAEQAELWATVTDAISAVRAAYQPHGLNVGMNLGRPAGGSVPNHVHAHIVPRWTGDTNFMSSIAGTQTLPESLETTTEKLRAVWGVGS